MRVKLKHFTVDDPNGHDNALLLHGDWIFIELIEPPYTGIGEATHSGNDRECLSLIYTLFRENFEDKAVDFELIDEFEKKYTNQDLGRVQGTAVSALSQAATDLCAKKNHMPVWRLFADRLQQDRVPVYVTINRALGSRSFDDYRRIVDEVQKLGFAHYKCAPFERVTPNCDQIKESTYGLSVLQMLADEYPDLQFRIDFHKRFSCDNFLYLISEIDKLKPFWIEEPCELNEAYNLIKQNSNSYIAAGELFFGFSPFKEIIDSGYIDVIMPDIKHIGGFCSMAKTCDYAQEQGVYISPHNPSSPVCAAASAQLAAIYPNVHFIEVPFEKIMDNSLYYRDLIQDGYIEINNSSGIGLSKLFK